MAGLLVLLGVTGWIAAPLATGAVAPASSDTRIDLEVPVSTSVTPGWKTGDAAVRLPNIAIPGVLHDTISQGWQMSTNWANGYDVRIRATSDPALRGSNAIDNRGARDSFADFSTSSGCPCAWSTAGSNKGVFGYSVSVASTGSVAPLDAAKWGSNQARKWRGFSKESYRAYSTQGGSDLYTMSLHFRSVIPDGAVQREGSYRAGVVVSAHPLL